VGQDLSIQAIRLRQMTSRLGEVANLARIGDHDRERRLDQRTGQGGLERTRGFQHNQRGSKLTHLFDDGGDPRLMVRHRKRNARTRRNIQPCLCHINADEHRCAHDILLSRPALRNAGSKALATVRAVQVKEQDDPC
jgi:hypothetical protein